MLMVFWTRVFLTFAGLFGALAVAVSAAAAHLLVGLLEPDQLDWVKTASSYQMVHAVALFGCAAMVNFSRFRIGVTLAGICFVMGTVFFSGSLYAMVYTGHKAFAAVTPFGGFAFIVGWLSLLWAGLRHQREAGQ
ncbi:MAG: DUF423 domain-containing protein [Burkholderiaceae bacterium]